MHTHMHMFMHMYTHVIRCLCFFLYLKVNIHVPKPTDSGLNLSYADSACFMHSNESVLAIHWTGSKEVGLNCSLQLKFLNQVSYLSRS